MEGFLKMVVGRPLLTVNQIQTRVRELAEKISVDYEGKDLLVVPILRGAFMFASDLVRAIRVPLIVDFITAESYVETETTGEIKIHCEPRESVRDKDVIIVEDIADTGITLNYIRERFLEQGARSVRVCVLLDKKERRVADIRLDYVGFAIPDEYVVGYGLDYKNKFRNLPYIAVFKKTT